MIASYLSYTKTLLFLLVIITIKSQCDTLTILRPDERALWRSGQNQKIEWVIKTGSIISGYNIFINYSDINDKWSLIKTINSPDSTSFEWTVGKITSIKALIKIVALKEKQPFDSAITSTPVIIQNNDLLSDVFSHRDTTGKLYAHFGLGFNIGISLDLLEGTKKTDLFSELRYYDPAIGIQDKSTILALDKGRLANIGLEFGIRQSKISTGQYSENINYNLNYVMPGNRVLKASKTDRFIRTLSMKSTSMEFSIFYPFPIARGSFFSTNSTQMRVDLFFHNEVFNRIVDANYKPRINSDFVNAEITDEKSNKIKDTTITLNISELNETYNQHFTYSYALGLSLLIASDDYDILVKWGSGAFWKTKFKAYAFYSANLYLKKVGGIAVGVRYWSSRVNNLIQNGPSKVPEGVTIEHTEFDSKGLNVGEEFEFYIVKFFSLQKFVDIFSIQ